MADLNFKISTGEASITSTAKTVIAIVAPTNQRVKIKGVKVWGKGTSNTDTPVKVELITATGISGGTVGSVVTQKTDTEMGETIQSTITGNYSVEPTYTSPVIDMFEVHPQTGVADYYPTDFEVKLKGGTGFAVRLTSNQAETMAVTLLCEE